MKSFVTLFRNELKLNIRNMNMVIFAVIMPVVVLIILGLIYGTKSAADGADYTFLEQSFGALCTISICAGGLMGLPLVVAEYRERKILRQHRTINSYRFCRTSACIFFVISHKNLLTYASMPAKFLCNLTKNLTAHLYDNNYAVLP